MFAIGCSKASHDRGTLPQSRNYLRLVLAITSA
jgi:hypothetical protein